MSEEKFNPHKYTSDALFELNMEFYRLREQMRVSERDSQPYFNWFETRKDERTKEFVKARNEYFKKIKKAKDEFTKVFNKYRGE